MHSLYIMLLLHVTENRAEERLMEQLYHVLPLQLCHAVLSNAVRCKYRCPFSIRVLHVLLSVLLTSSFCLLWRFSLKYLLLTRPELLQTKFCALRRFRFQSGTASIKTRFSLFRCFTSFLSSRCRSSSLSEARRFLSHSWSLGLAMNFVAFGGTSITLSFTESR